eukprot:TRINITY_DN10406_c0_g1_i1.p1 TRINITY_DN10406_c0_g1~~TRINITY_DN10406_c0_g1_i1.p1  ORF type:complete len:432 (+),score=81.85 TRINITY_DN10406_c0_g1_i1:290-1585(+)
MPAIIHENPERFFDFWGGLFDYHRDHKPPRLFTIINRWKHMLFSKLSSHGATFSDRYAARYRDVFSASGCLTDDAVEDPAFQPHGLPGPFFILTNQVEGDFLRSGILIDEIYEIIGSVERWQCSKTCKRVTWTLDPFLRIRNLPLSKHMIPATPTKSALRKKRRPPPVELTDPTATDETASPTNHLSTPTGENGFPLPSAEPSPTRFTSHMRPARIALPPLPLSIAAARMSLAADSVRGKQHAPLVPSSPLKSQASLLPHAPHAPHAPQSPHASHAATQELSLPPDRDDLPLVDDRFRLEPMPACPSCGASSRPAIYLNEEDEHWISNHACWKNYLSWMVEVCRQSNLHQSKIVIVELGADQRDHSLRMMTEEFFASAFKCDITFVRIGNNGQRPETDPPKTVNVYTTCDIALSAIDSIIRERTAHFAKMS